MYATIIMNEKKELHKTTTPTIYQHENNADEILILVPEYYGDLNLKECNIMFNWLQPSENEEENRGNIKLLEFENELYNNLYLQLIVPLTVTETANAGDIEIFLNIINEQNQVDMKTGSVFLGIKSHKKITDYIPEESLSLLSDYMIKMQQLVNTSTQTLELATEQADRAEKSANLIIEMLQAWEDEHK